MGAARFRSQASVQKKGREPFGFAQGRLWGTFGFSGNEDLLLIQRMIPETQLYIVGLIG